MEANGLGEAGNWPVTGQWIWAESAPRHFYHQTIIARRSFKLQELPRRALCKITADTCYRLRINGHWIGDGPGRAWPMAYLYDEHEVAQALVPGENLIEVTAVFFGIGTQHQVPIQPGLLMNLWDTGEAEGLLLCKTDQDWEVAVAPAWSWNTTCRWWPAEGYDAGRAGREAFAPARLVCDAEKGPWRNLSPRPTPTYHRERRYPRRFLGAVCVQSSFYTANFPVARLLHPQRTSIDLQKSFPCAVATNIVVEKPCQIRVLSDDFRLFLNGLEVESEEQTLEAGANFLLGLADPPIGFHVAEKAITFPQPDTMRLENPINSSDDNPWVLARVAELEFHIPGPDSDMVPTGERAAFARLVEETYDRLGHGVRDGADFQQAFADERIILSREEMLQEDPHRHFYHRQVLADVDPIVKGPTRFFAENSEETIIIPSSACDTELLIDFGDQVCGYYSFELHAPQGTVIDIWQFEYVAPDGTYQHTYHADPRIPVANGMRYTCREGENQFLSLRRRSGRYVALTFRKATAPIRLRQFHIVESLHPIEQRGSFRCSDVTWNEIWKTAARTLHLCMEDGYVDCPLYEQTLWIGDARNQALYGYIAFGAAAISRRGWVLGAESLHRLPMIGCQVPSCWDVILPAWSFLWHLGIWEYYFATGDSALLEEVWPAVEQNLQAAEEMLDQHGLFAAPYWNMFDWANVDHAHRTVTHNSLLMVGAIQASIKAAEVIGKDVQSLRRLEDRLVKSINELWNDELGGLVDSVHEDGTLSSSVCIHNAFLALLFDVLEGKRKEVAIQSLLDPPKSMVLVGSPFAVHFQYEALVKTKNAGNLLQHMYQRFTEMIDMGGTTFWESFPDGILRHGIAPTRSHCHAWSSSPILFLNEVVLGIRATSAGGRSFMIHPYSAGLRWAEGATAIARDEAGAIKVRWKREEEWLDVEVCAPADITITFGDTDECTGLVIRGRRVSSMHLS